MTAALEHPTRGHFAHEKPAREGNAIIAAMAPGDRNRLLEMTEDVSLDSGTVVCVPERPIDRIYFPLTAVLSVLSILGDGSGVETAVVGNDGVAPIAPFHGVRTSAEQIVAQVPGNALWIEREAFERLLPDLPSLPPVLHRFTQALFTMTAQSSACNRKHSVVQRCARWLLLTHDRVPGDDFSLTHVFLAQMLGVRRSSVTIAAEALRASGAIDYTRGRIRVVDRVKLHGISCECYDIVRSTYARLLDAQHIKNPLAEVVMSASGHSLTHAGEPDTNHIPDPGDKDYSLLRSLGDVRDRLALALERSQEVMGSLQTGARSQQELQQASATLSRALVQLQEAEEELRSHLDALSEQ